MVHLFSGLQGGTVVSTSHAGVSDCRATLLVMILERKDGGEHGGRFRE